MIENREEGGTIPLIVGRIFKFESRISLGPPAMGHRSQSIRGESLSLFLFLCSPRVTKNRIRAAKKTDRGRLLFLSLSSSSPATRDAFACEKASLKKGRRILVIFGYLESIWKKKEFWI